MSRPSESLAAAYRDRQARLAAWLARAEEHACVVDDLENARSSSLRWLTGHPMDAVLIVFADGATVLIPWDVHMANEHAVVGEIIPSSEFKRSYREGVNTVLRAHGVEASIGGPSARRRVEFPGRTSHIRYKELREDLPGAEIVLRTDGFETFIGAARTVKDATEIAAHRRGAEITNTILEHLEAKLHASGGADGVREFDMAQFIEREALALGAEAVGFETIAAGPTRSWGIHAVPAYGAGPFASAGLSILDFGVKVGGYTSDVTVTVARGRLNPTQEKMIALVEEAYTAAVGCLGLNVSPLAPAQKAEQVFAAAGWKMPHSLGHGIGMDVHESPLLRSTGDGTEKPLGAGMIFTVEPGLYHPEHGGVRWENDVLMTETGPEVLTRSRVIRIE